MDREIDFEVTGITDVIKRYRLNVPSNQREYSWMKDAQVKELLQDITTALRTPSKPYFLGTIVLTKGSTENYEIADGQQRLATTTMIIAAIRDWFISKGKAIIAQSLEQDFLFTIDREQEELIPKLSLNLDDNEFFKSKILARKHNKTTQQPIRRSHKLLLQAFEEIQKHIVSIEKTNGDNTAQVLHDWIKYLQNNANVVRLTVLNSENAFKMFETLNDRGLKTSQADLVKNHLFRVSGNRLLEAQKLWSSMRGAIETVTDDDDITMDFLKASCSIIAGITSKKDVMKVIQDRTQNKTECIKMMTLLEELSKDYAAIINPEHQKWNEYDMELRKSIQAINLFGGTQISPLMLAISRYFNKKDVSVSFRKIVSWAVRYRITNVIGGRLDIVYSSLANKIHSGEIKNESQLKKHAEKDVIKDAEFKTAFEIARVSNARMGRYYLRSLETTAQKNQELLPNDDNLTINLEHILPTSPTSHWKHIKPQDYETHYNRIGNLALLRADKNSDIGNLDFNSKKETYKSSLFILTKELSSSDNWNISKIEKRQKSLAKLAVGDLEALKKLDKNTIQTSHQSLVTSHLNQ